MTLNEIKACLQAGSLQVANESALANGTGTQLRLQNGAIAAAAAPQNGAAAKPMLSKAFVVFGYETAARTELEAMLHHWRLEPLIRPLSARRNCQNCYVRSPRTTKSATSKHALPCNC